MIRSLVAAAIVAGFTVVLVLGGRGHPTTTEPLPAAPPLRSSTPLVVPPAVRPSHAVPAHHRAARPHAGRTIVPTLTPSHVAIRVATHAPARHAIVIRRVPVRLPRHVVTSPAHTQQPTHARRAAPKPKASGKGKTKPKQPTTPPATPPKAAPTPPFAPPSTPPATPPSTPPSTPPTAPTTPTPAPTPSPTPAPTPREPASVPPQTPSTPSTPTPTTPTTPSVPTRPGNGNGDENHHHTGPPGCPPAPVTVPPQPPVVNVPVPPVVNPPVTPWPGNGNGDSNHRHSGPPGSH